jgi:hypothetical protein
VLHPELLDFQRRLDAAGVVVAVHSDHLCVRLTLLASVRVRYDGTRLAFEPRFGAVPRATATASTFFAGTAGIIALIVTGAALPMTIGVGVLGVLGSAFDVMRYVVTESAITRVTMLWATRSEASIPGILGSGPARPMHAGGETVRAPLHVE